MTDPSARTKGFSKEVFCAMNVLSEAMQENVMSAKSIYVGIVIFWDRLKDTNHPTS
jgi:hypothetical protein